MEFKAPGRTAAGVPNCSNFDCKDTCFDDVLSNLIADKRIHGDVKTTTKDEGERVRLYRLCIQLDHRTNYKERLTTGIISPRFEGGMISGSGMKGFKPAKTRQ